jgi:putative NADPH-quinone reductase
MNILYVYAHPNPASFNHALKEHALKLFKQENINIQVSDLYAEHFKAQADWADFSVEEANTQYFLAQQAAFQQEKLTPDIQAELKKIAKADHIIFQFPLWWFSTPAILKGWLDRVLVKGFAYDAGKVFTNGLLKGKTASLVVTTQSPESAYQLDGLHEATIDSFLHHIHHTLRFVGIQPLSPFVSYAAFNLESAQQEKIIADYQAYLKNLIT